MADDTLQDINDAIGSSGANWEAGDNPIWRLPREQQLLRLGATPPADYPSPNENPSPHAPRGPSLPPAFDLRNVGGKNYITDIRDQANCGSCVAFGCLATIEGAISWIKKTASPKIDLSEAHLYYCYGSKQGVTCNTGWWPERALPYCVSQGVVDEPCFPYKTPDQPCKLCSDWAQRLTKITSFTKFTSPSPIKQWIYDKGPVVGCFIVYDDFFSYKSGVYRHVSGNQAGGHCIAIVGYDDTNRCWICKNSWGTSWGERGFFRIEYGQCGIDTWDNIGVDV